MSIQMIVVIFFLNRRFICKTFHSNKYAINDVFYAIHRPILSLNRLLLHVNSNMREYVTRWNITSSPKYTLHKNSFISRMPHAFPISILFFLCFSGDRRRIWYACRPQIFNHSNWKRCAFTNKIDFVARRMKISDNNCILRWMNAPTHFKACGTGKGWDFVP